MSTLGRVIHTKAFVKGSVFLSFPLYRRFLL